MQYREFINNNGERLWLPFLAGAAIISAPFWLGANNNKCCTNNQQYPMYQANYYPYQTPYMPYSPYPYYSPYILQNNFK